jgi:phosphatidylserine/phosphatidylglycerophosphate/cardiolipin synthase-like enzyme
MKSLVKDIHVINDGTIQFPILPNGSGWKSTEQSNLSVVESGEQKTLFSKIINAIDKAQEFVCLQSFLIQDSTLIDSLLKAVERKVKVFVLSSVEARLKDKIEEETDFIKTDYIQLIDKKFKNHFVHRTAENFHAKYILIDPKTNPKGFICTNNFTENGFAKNPELAVELNIEQCEELFKVFVYHFWEHSTDEQTATTEFEKVKPANKFSLSKLNDILLTSPNKELNTLNKALINAVRNGKKSISLSTFQLDKNTELIKTILEKAKQGIDVTLFCRPTEKQFNEQLKDLLEAGVQIYFHPLIHAKSFLIDDNNGFVFTANLTNNGLEKGLEVGVKLNEQQTADLSKIHKNWKEDFPLKAFKTAFIKDLKEFEIFKDGKLTRKILLDDSKEEKRKIIKVSDLLSFFNQKPQIKENSTKSLKLRLTAEIESLQKDIKANCTDKFEVIEITEPKDKKTKVVVLNDSFTPNDIHQLNDLKELKIYFATT